MTSRRPGLFVTLEGIDRSGKSTQAQLLADALGPSALAVREPGGTRLGEHIRGILKDPASPPSPEAEALLFAAARAQLVSEVIKPALDQGLIVICDRFLDSSLAYQGAARGLGVEAVRAINRFGVGTLTPDLTLLLEIDPRLAVGRAGEVDRFEAEGLRLQELVADAYRELARAEQDRWRVIDADQGEARVHAEVLAQVEQAVAASRSA